MCLYFKTDYTASGFVELQKLCTPYIFTKIHIGSLSYAEYCAICLGADAECSDGNYQTAAHLAIEAGEAPPPSKFLGI